MLRGVDEFTELGKVVTNPYWDGAFTQSKKEAEGRNLRLTLRTMGLKLDRRVSPW